MTMRKPLNENIPMSITEQPNPETITANEEAQELNANPDKKCYGSFAELVEDIGSVRPAVEALIAEAHEVALGRGEYSTYEEIFGSDDEGMQSLRRNENEFPGRI